MRSRLLTIVALHLQIQQSMIAKFRRAFTSAIHGIFRHVESETTAPTPVFATKYGLLQVFR